MKRPTGASSEGRISGQAKASTIGKTGSGSGMPNTRTGVARSSVATIAINAGQPIQAQADAIEGLAEHRQQGRAFVGERHATRQALEQHGPQTFLQRLDLVAQRGLADAQFVGGAGQVLVARGGLEGAQGVERQLGPEHDLS